MLKKDKVQTFTNVALIVFLQTEQRRQEEEQLVHVAEEGREGQEETGGHCAEAAARTGERHHSSGMRRDLEGRWGGLENGATPQG